MRVPNPRDPPVELLLPCSPPFIASPTQQRPVAPLRAPATVGPSHGTLLLAIPHLKHSTSDNTEIRDTWLRFFHWIYRLCAAPTIRCRNYSDAGQMFIERPTFNVLLCSFKRWCRLGWPASRDCCRYGIPSHEISLPI